MELLIAIIAMFIICLLWCQHLGHRISNIEKTLFSWTENQIAYYRINNLEHSVDIHDKKLDTLYDIEIARRQGEDKSGREK